MTYNCQSIEVQVAEKLMYKLFEITFGNDM